MLKRALYITLITACPFILLSYNAQCQTTASTDTIQKKYSDQKDIIDLIQQAIHKGRANRVDTGTKTTTKLHISGVPAAGYTLQTGLAGLLTANAVFGTTTDAKESTVLTSFTYTVRKQIIVPLQSSIWTKGNKYNIVTDWRYLKFPSYTYGLGGNTTLADGYLINYNAARIHQTVLRKFAQNVYGGVGYNVDYFWKVKELDPPANTVTDFQVYGHNTTEFASGFTFNFLYDTRTNALNPERGILLNMIYRPNLVIFGNTATWRSLILEVRKYFKFPAGSNNVLALWGYEWLTINGKPPYLMLPNTGGDQYSNTGRGYIQGRFRGRNMAYLESEYRFVITHNGLLGGVVFANAEAFTERIRDKIETIAPGAGFGIRLKLNKFSRTNLAIDYGFGAGGSSGLFVNLGEVF